MTSRVLSLLTLATLLCPACAYEEEDVEFRMPSTTTGTGGGPGNGTVFNTNVVDMAAVSELRQPIGVVHQGAALGAVVLEGGQVVDHFEVVGGDVVAHATTGEVFSGTQLNGSRWWIIAGEDSFVGEWVDMGDRVLIDGWPHWRFSREGFTGTTCLTGEGPGYARLLPGFSLNEATGQVTALADNTYVACTNGATGKAAGWGYYDLAMDLEDLEIFEVAIRTIRADYCYDGVSHTVAGVPLLIEDAWAVNLQGIDEEEERKIEAVWGESGLLCRGSGRLEAIPPSCGGEKAKIPSCQPGTTIDTYPDAMFVTRLP
jgi:hypothetical protein